jgi:hypothetical protein
MLHNESMTSSVLSITHFFLSLPFLLSHTKYSPMIFSNDVISDVICKHLLVIDTKLIAISFAFSATDEVEFKEDESKIKTF